MKINIFIIILGYWVLLGQTNKPKKMNSSDNSKVIETSIEDGIDWETYCKRGDIYLSRSRFKPSPISGDILSYCARETYNTYGVFIPVELALAQAQWESGMGLKGRSPKNNPCNLGEYSNKTVLRYKSTKEGMLAYYKLIATNYLDFGKKTIFDLFENKFKDVNGYMYAGSNTYGLRIKKQYQFIVKWIDDKYWNNNDGTKFQVPFK
tara:strand:- start:1413 stop:2033 length:621 start_codon:yes stop_codon:yes gene_type:complete